MVIFRFFKMAAADILGFRNFKFLTVGTVKRVEPCRHAKFCWNRPNRGRDMVIFRFFKTAAAVIFDFRNFKFLTVKRVELRHRAKFRQNRSNHGWNMAIFLFLKMAAAAILDFRNFKFLTVGRSNHVTTPNFVEIGQNAAEISRFIDFSRWLRRHLGF